MTQASLRTAVKKKKRKKKREHGHTHEKYVQHNPEYNLEFNFKSEIIKAICHQEGF